MNTDALKAASPAPSAWRSPEGRWSPLALWAAGGGALALALLVGATQGAYSVALADLWPGARASAGADIFWHIRAPRLVMAVLTGAALGMSGALVQGLFRNPLADPGLIGVSSGAALGAGIAIVFGPHLPLALRDTLGVWPMMACAFLGGLLVTALVWQLSRARGQVHTPLLLLVGVAINALASAGLGLLSHLASDIQLRTLTFWLLGSLGGSQWQGTLACAVVVLAVLCIAPSQARALNAMALGEAQARLMGVPVDKVQRHCVLWVALAVGAVTALTGMVGFIGLLAPHAVRLLAGPDHRIVLPASAAMGAVLVLLADTIARTAFAPADLPLGVLTGLIGAPAFLWMLRHRFITT